YGEAAITLLTVQNTTNVSRVQVMSPGMVADQIRAVVADIPPAAAKTGALGSAEMIAVIAAEAAKFRFPLVVDPVMISKHGAPLLPPAAADSLRRLLLPVCDLVTPNLYEAAELTGAEIDDVEAMKEAAARIADMGPKAVLLKGGHLTGEARDILYLDGMIHEYPSERIDTPHTHGTGCTYSAAITACLARGMALPAAIALAKRFITEAIRSAPGLGRGQGPVNHFADAGLA
ncbi:MAG: bifunctional hydroxymethylpyrimidine kinase/phosphomethylpyrimidine kinase, partial [Bryobacterales bacterium]|nr:bifunctional hydroxymethylpyrimidine kinase/phosphomethylpyrimidine kinase [Bryobacterales bacterium]